MIAPTLEADPDCWEPAGSTTRPTERRHLCAELRPFASIEPETWDALAGLNPAATPFSAWAFQQAWWDGYGENAHDHAAMQGDQRPPTPAPEPVNDPRKLTPKQQKIAATLAKLTPEDRAAAAKQKFCAVLKKNELGSMGVPIKLVLDGKPLFLCCPACLDTALEKWPTAKRVEAADGTQR